MEKIDARKLRGKGMPNNEVAQIVGISPQTILGYYTRYKREGKKVFEVKSAGCPQGINSALNKEQEQKIIRMLIDINPTQLKFEFALWIREAVQTLIKTSIRY